MKEIKIFHKLKFQFAEILLLSLLLLSCSNIKLKCAPVVVVTNIDYTSHPTSVPYENAHQDFTDTYTGTDLSFELRATIIERMEEIADLLDENENVLTDCIIAAYGDSWNSQPMRIPCYAEKCRYENQTIWAIAFNRANVLGGDIGHFDLYFVSLNTKAILFHDCCY